jgi:Sulfotransferase domain
MKYTAKRIIKYLLGTDVAGRQIAVRPDDKFIVSYPRSGNTWTRFLLANLLFDQPVSLANIEQLIPDAEALSSRAIKRMPSPRVIKSHQYFDHRYPQVLYVVRDPRDVLLSYYNFSRKYRHIADDYPLQQYVHGLVTGTLHRTGWGTWGENVGSWVAARSGHPKFLLLHYEDLIADTQSELARVAKFFGVNPTSEQLCSAILHSSADRMRKLESKEAGEWIATRNKRADIPMIGTAVPGKWRSAMPQSAVEEIEAAWGDLMAQLGYDLVTRTK